MASLIQRLAGRSLIRNLTQIRAIPVQKQFLGAQVSFSQRKFLHVNKLNFLLNLNSDQIWLALFSSNCSNNATSVQVSASKISKVEFLKQFSPTTGLNLAGLSSIPILSRIWDQIRWITWNQLWQLKMNLDSRFQVSSTKIPKFKSFVKCQKFLHRNSSDIVQFLMSIQKEGNHRNCSSLTMQCTYYVTKILPPPLFYSQIFLRNICISSHKYVQMRNLIQIPINFR